MSQSNWPIGDKPTESRDTEQYSGYWERRKLLNVKERLPEI